MARDSQLMISLMISRQRIPWAHARRLLIAALIAVLLLLGLSLILPNHAHAHGTFGALGAFGTLATVNSAQIATGALAG